MRLVFPHSGLEIGGEMNLAAGIQVAQLALKHRQNKKQQQRIIVFAGRWFPDAFLYIIFAAATPDPSINISFVSALLNMTRRSWR